MCADQLLPISLAGGINILEPGRVWLEKHLIGRSVWFKPLRVTNDSKLECIVMHRTVGLLFIFLFYFLFLSHFLLTTVVHCEP